MEKIPPRAVSREDENSKPVNIGTALAISTLAVLKAVTPLGIIGAKFGAPLKPLTSILHVLCGFVFQMTLNFCPLVARGAVLSDGFIRGR